MLRRLLTILILVVSLIVTVGPVLLVLIQSISFQWRWPDLFPNELRLDAWYAVFADPSLTHALKYSMIITASVVMLTIVISLPAARALAFDQFKGKSFIETVLMLPLLIPLLFIVMGIHLSMIRLNLADTLSGVILVHLLPTVPYAIRILRTGYERIGLKWYEQATVLGASRLKQFWTITVPLIMPSIRSAIVLTVVISLSQYALTAIIGGGVVTTLPIIYYPYFSSANQSIMAAFTMLFAFLPILFWFCIELVCKSVTTMIKQP
ncbi:ABC transporter permease [Pseudalkalibacillus berkeleyi]|uniref:ABC transporter permease subunit n=1 Tax=Pseudalkalibacillus berkeleyi TaxID=1069813 RepID=A0ABS9H0V0_9BACL|nr:ABC transporter permease subunit [Pseudalkalibacillus berkeleyi]MCF6137422.1 ABC transporter permease subunit [Pseudalkalibacillus berkeleyi]